MMTVAEFWGQVAAYRRAVAGSVTSGGRSPNRNARVGGKPNSAHLLDLGADVIHDGLTSGPARETLARGLGLRLIVEDDHDHLQPLDWGVQGAAKPERA
jgi:hypothetical protein